MKPKRTMAAKALRMGRLIVGVAIAVSRLPICLAVAMHGVTQRWESDLWEWPCKTVRPPLCLLRRVRGVSAPRASGDWRESLRIQ